MSENDPHDQRRPGANRTHLAGHRARRRRCPLGSRELVSDRHDRRELCRPMLQRPLEGR